MVANSVVLIVPSADEVRYRPNLYDLTWNSTFCWGCCCCCCDVVSPTPSACDSSLVASASSSGGTGNKKNWSFSPRFLVSDTPPFLVEVRRRCGCDNELMKHRDGCSMQGKIPRPLGSSRPPCVSAALVSSSLLSAVVPLPEISVVVTLFAIATLSGASVPVL